MDRTLFTHLKTLGTPLALVYANHNVVFSLDAETQDIVYTVDFNGENSKQYTFGDGNDLIKLATDLSNATKRETGEAGLYTCGNLVRIHDSLRDIVNTGYHYAMDNEYMALIAGVVKAMAVNDTKAFTMEYGDITVSITYSDMMLHVSVRVPGEYCDTKHFGLTSDIYGVSDYISNQLHEVDSLAMVPNRALVLDTLEILTGL